MNTPRHSEAAKVLANGIRLNCYQIGDGPNVVLVHGMATNLAFWYFPILPMLSHHFRVAAFDLRGHGYSEMPLSGYTSAEMARDLVGLLDRLKIDNAHLVGHSFGGAVALHCAALFPERVRTITVADGRIRSLQPHQKISDWPFWERWRSSLAELDLHLDGSQEMDYTLLEKLAHRAVVQPLRAIGGDWTFVPFAGWNGGTRNAKTWLRLLDSTNARAEFQLPDGLTSDVIRSIKHPILAMYGEYSFCHGSCEGLRESACNCEFSIVPGAGHYHPLIRPAFFVESVKRFIDSYEGRAPWDATRS